MRRIAMFSQVILLILSLMPQALAAESEHYQIKSEGLVQSYISDWLPTTFLVTSLNSDSQRISYLEADDIVLHGFTANIEIELSYPIKITFHDVAKETSDKYSFHIKQGATISEEGARLSSPIYSAELRMVSKEIIISIMLLFGIIILAIPILLIIYFVKKSIKMSYNPFNSGIVFAFFSVGVPFTALFTGRSLHYSIGTTNGTTNIPRNIYLICACVCGVVFLILCFYKCMRQTGSFGFSIVNFLFQLCCGIIIGATAGLALIGIVVLAKYVLVFPSHTNHYLHNEE